MGIKSGNGEGAQQRSENFNSSKIGSISRVGSGDLVTDDRPLASLGQPESAMITARVLEPRILLDAAALETAEVAMDTLAEQQANDYFNRNAVAPVLAETREVSNQRFFEPADNDLHTDENVGTNKTIVFIDPTVDNLDGLISEIDPEFEIVILDPAQDGVEQIATYLSGYTDLSAIHILSHGDAGVLNLGNTQLTSQSITDEHADEMASISQSLSENADILIYGCDFGAGETGSEAVRALAAATGADIAASDDLTGSADLGGDWDLEIQSGNVEAFAISPSSWAGILDLTITDIGVGGTGVSGPAVTALAQEILGDGVTINSAIYSGGPIQAATFSTGAGSSFGSNVLSFTEGAIFSTGSASSVAGPNNQDGFTIDAPGIDGDAQFDTLAGNNTFDASFLEMSFTPDVPPGSSVGDSGRMTMEIVFGSDEYNEYVYGGVNDTLAVIVNGTNQAVVPNGLAIGIDTINGAGTFNPAYGDPSFDPNPEHTAAGFESANESLYTNNETNVFNTQMDGFTITVPVTFDVIVGQVNTIKIGIADTGDEAFDSWMFVKADSGQTVIVAENDSVTTPTDVPFTLDVTANDFDLQGDALTVTHILGQPVSPGDVIALASGATVTIEANGDLTVAGDGVNAVNDAFTYSITDGNGGTSTAFVNLNITGPNSAPLAVNDGPVTVPTGIAQNIDVIGNDSDPDGQALAITQIIDPANAGSPIAISVGSPITLTSGTIVELLPDGTLNVTSPTAVIGTDTFDYVISDGALTDQATVTLNVVNTAPVAQNDDLTVSEDGPAATGSLFADNSNGVDSDANGDTITVSQVNGLPANVDTQITLASGALLTVNSDGSYDYDPNGAFESLGAGDTAADSFTYTISDGNGGTSTATVNLTINGQNDNPVLDLDTNDVTATGSDFEATYTENNPAINIVESIFTLTDPDNDLTEMVITLTDGQIGDTLQFPSSMPGGITASVMPIATLTSAGTLTLTLTGTAATTIADWNAVLAAITFLPSTNDVHNPDPSDRNITVEATDSQNVSTGLATALIHVMAENDPPSLDLDDDNSGGVNAGNYTGEFIEDGGSVPIHSEIIISDLDNTDLQSASVELTNPQSDDQLIVDGVVVYDNGTITAAAGTSNGVGYTVALVSGSPVVTFSGTETIANYTAALESVSFNNTSQEPDITPRVIEVVINDGTDNSSTRTATLSVTEVNDPPQIQDPLNPGVEAPTFNLPALASDDGDLVTGSPEVDLSQYFFDVDPSDTLSFAVSGLPNGLSVNPATGEITGTIDGSASQGGAMSDGVYTISVDVTDGEDTTSVSFDWVISNPAPDAMDDGFATDQNTVISDNLITNILPLGADGSDTDPDGDVLSVSQINGAAFTPGTQFALPSGALLTMNSDGSFDYDPNGQFESLGAGDSTTDGFTYTLVDADGASDTAMVSFTINGLNDIPVIDTPVADQSFEDAETVSVLPSISDPDGDTLTYSATGLPVGLSIDPTTGEISGTVNNSASIGGDDPIGAPGVYEVTITADDGEGGTIDDVISFTITNPAPVIDTPVADQSFEDAETVSVLPSISDPDGDTLTYSATGLPTGLTIDPTTGEISGTVDNSASIGGDDPIGAPGVYEVTITADDGEGGTIDDVISFTITNPAPVIDTPVADQSFEDAETVSVLPSISDPDGDTLTYSATGLPVGLSIDPITGEISGTVDNSASIGGDDPIGAPGVYEVTVTADDGEGGTIDDVISVTITNPAPVVDTPVADQSFEDAETVSVLPSISDPDGDTLTYSATGLPAGLTIDPTTGEISGTVDNSASIGGDDPIGAPGVYEVTITADDGEGGTIDDVISFTITNPAPVAHDDDVTVDEDTVLNGDVHLDNGNGADIDPDGDDIDVTLVGGDAGNVGNAAAGSNGGLFTINADGTYSFDPGTDFQDLTASQSRTTSITYTIDDGEGGTSQATVEVTVTGENDGPVIIDPNVPITNPNDPPVPGDPNNVIIDITGSDATPLPSVDASPYFYDVEGDPITFSLDPGTTPPWLSIDPISGEINGTPPSDASQGGPASDGVYTVTIIGTDDDGLTGSTTLTFTIENIDPITTGLPDDTEVAGYNYELPSAPAFSDPDMDPLTFGASGLPGGLTIDPVTGLISGMVDPMAVGNAPNGDGVYAVTVTADDGEGGLVSTTFELTITDPVGPQGEAPEGPLGEAGPDGPPQPLNSPEMIIDAAVNQIDKLGQNTGLFNLNHPVTEALYQISPLSEGISLDSNGHPVSAANDWISKTREALSDKPQEVFYLGNDQAVQAQGSEFIIRTLAWNDVFFIEAIGASSDLSWQIESVDGAQKPSWAEAYGNNLFALQLPADASNSRITLLGTNSSGVRIQLEVDIGQSDGLRKLSSVSDTSHLQGLDGQIQALLNQPKFEARSLLHTSI